eukprot:Tamp_21072.p1 GENE.Tamp_21072~~Tamp_21072.p1  ORF type:complete len:329 (+),score=62.23 Tamp_21072:44-988(+)
MAAGGSQSRQELKLAITEIQRQLKAKGNRLSDASRQASDALDALLKFRYLRPGIGMMAGCESGFLELKGTVQMQFGGHGYFVPLAVFLRDDHPESPPVCIIQPTAEMMIKPNHHHVDVQGLVYLPYLHGWTRNSSVVDMLLALEEVFGREPFIFKKPAATASASPAQSSPAQGGGAAASKRAAGRSEQPLPTVYKRSPEDKARDEAVLKSSEKHCMGLSGQVLLDEVKKKSNDLEELDAVLEASFRCPISMEIMTDPVFAADGHTYEKVEMERWLQTHETSPLTNEKLPHKHLAPNHNLRGQIQQFQDLGGFGG